YSRPQDLAAGSNGRRDRTIGSYSRRCSPLAATYTQCQFVYAGSPRIGVTVTSYRFHGAGCLLHVSCRFVDTDGWFSPSLMVVCCVLFFSLGSDTYCCCYGV
ncbi:unnamed protein product, partial [Ectocarpus sp. 12 AP-2014]